MDECVEHSLSIPSRFIVCRYWTCSRSASVDSRVVSHSDLIALGTRCIRLAISLSSSGCSHANQSSQ